MTLSVLFRLAGVALASLLIWGCSSNDEVVPPSPTPQFKSQIQIKKLWTSRIGEGVGEVYLSLKPAATERWVYAASLDGDVKKFDREKGKTIWKVSLDREITGGVSAAYGMVGLGTANGELLLLSEETGEIVLEKTLGGQVMSVPAITPELVVVQTTDGRLHALNREDGAVVWLFDTSIPILTLRGESDPVVSGGATLAGFANGKLVAMDTNTGYVAWERQVGESKGRSELERLVDLDGRFWVDGKVVYAATYQGNIVAIDIPSGRVLWKRPMSSYVGVTSYLGKVYVVDQDSVLHAMDAIGGTDLWQQDRLKGRVISTPTAYDRYVLVGDFNGFLYWLSHSDGEFLARVKVGHNRYQYSNARAGSLRRVTDPADGIRVEPVIYDDTVYIQGNSGELAAYRVVTEQ
ncbi:MAG: outer membrane protein assembly factor BamB [Pseudomonadales bacterium]|nr:outer membrane protein assembly factor BamB [Pseudomonadales bacterium]